MAMSIPNCSRACSATSATGSIPKTEKPAVCAASRKYPLAAPISSSRPEST